MTDYGVVILTNMAFLRGQVLSAAAIAQNTKLPEPTVSKILKLLAKHNLVASIRGTNGGYVFDKAPEDLNIADVISATEGPIKLASCVDKHSTCCDHQSHCAVKGAWNPVNLAMQSALENVSLKQMMGGVHVR